MPVGSVCERLLAIWTVLRVDNRSYRSVFSVRGWEITAFNNRNLGRLQIAGVGYTEKRDRNVFGSQHRMPFNREHHSRRFEWSKP